jgi:hypothetical protein
MKTVTERGGQKLEKFNLETSQNLLYRLLKDLFENHWKTIVFGSLIQRAVFEVRAPNAPKRISLSDGYLTIDFGSWHFQVCIGDHRGSRGHPIDPALAAHQRHRLCRTLPPPG